ncbi:sorting nexin-2-like [Diadema antillarum]|uniref:sorting nexin-2-like n=1 Tax=Diadema antillarum TaxID=105358 RepID=UPI003A8C17E7
MADDREPPPLFDDDEKSEEKVAETNKESSEPAALEEDDDLFAGGGTEVSLDDPPEGDSSQPAKLDSEPAKLDAEPSSPLAKDTEPSDAAAVKEPEGAAGGDGDGSQTKMEEEDEVDDDESRDKFDLEITITEPQKMGDGMSAYMAYKVTTKTNDPSFKGKEMCVTRRFSDFLGLHQKLVEKHTCKGRIVPPAPEKSVVGMTKVKMSKSQEQTNSMEFIGKRRAALERFLNRTAAHPILYTDSDFREFLEKDDLPKATSTSALSGAGVMRAFTKVVDSASKVVSRMNESDQWFEEKQHMIDSLDAQLKKLHTSVESMVTGRKELASTTSSFAKSAAMLGNSEEHTALSRAISQLAETEEKIEALHSNQAATDFYVLSELLKDYIGLLAAVREAFREREKSYLTWQNAQTTLSKKRDLEAKLKVSGKPEKLQQVQEEIKDWTNKEVKGQEDFETVSKTLRREIKRFESNRVRDFRTVVIKYLESLMNHQQQLIQYWEAFLPEATAIA